MARLSRYVELRDLSRTYPRFEFEGRRAPGYCHVKIDIRAGVPVLMLSRLINYFGLPIDEASVAIRRKIISILYEEGVVVSNRRRTLATQLFPNLFEARQRRDILDYFDERAIWVSHKSVRVGEEDEEERYAFVDFRRVYATPVDLEDVMKASGLDRDFFYVPHDELVFASALEHCHAPVLPHASGSTNNEPI